jgi:polyvinyl alcohol dehydrogenase (cytochrome)
MIRLRSTAALAGAALLAACSNPPAGGPQLAGLDDDEHPGRAVYDQFCAACHDHPQETRAPALASIQQLGFRGVRAALINGSMSVQGDALTNDQQIAVASWLDESARRADTSWIAANACTGRRKGVQLADEAAVPRFGVDLQNRRALSAAAAGLFKDDLSNLELAWAFGFPGNISMRAQPAVSGDQLFISVPESGQVFALDIAGDPCVEWVYEPGVPLRSAITLGKLPSGRDVLVFADAAVRETMLDAVTGDVIWTADVALGDFPSNATGAPILLGDRVYAPISAGEITIGANPAYECCKSHGGVVALDAATGAHVWEYHTMEQAQPTQVSRVGTQLWGPSGAPIWTTPAIDEARGQLYDGALRWKFQATENDVFLTGCMTDRTGPNCPPMDVNLVDYDFGASIMLAKTSDGSDIVLAGQKSGMLWALDPDTGALIWSADVGPGGPAGGIHWGLATDGTRVFAGVNRVSAPGEDMSREPGLHAINIDTGEVEWSVFVKPDCEGDRRERIPSCDSAFGFSAAPIVIDGAVVEGGLDGLVRIFDGATGALIWSYDTAKPFETVNGVEARGGSIDNAGIVAANGLLIAPSGYGLLGEQAGNVLLAFKPK